LPLGSLLAGSPRLSIGGSLVIPSLVFYAPILIAPPSFRFMLSLEEALVPDYLSNASIILST